MSFYSLASDKILQTPEFDSVNDAIESINLKFPHIANKIKLFWGDRAFKNYMSSLLLDSRGGRQGFPERVMKAILYLQSVHNSRFPEFDPPAIKGRWSFDGVDWR